MNFRTYRSEEPDISLAPLIDVVFLLLIFFMVTTTFRKEGEFDVSLPEASHTETIMDDQQLMIVVDAAGFYQVGDLRLPDRRLSTLSSALKSVVGAEHERPIAIRADAQTSYQAIVRILDAASQLGLKNVGIVAVSEHQPE